MKKRKKITRRYVQDTKFTRHTRARFYAALSERIPATRAARVAGTSKDTYMNWMRMGRDEPERYPVHAEFRRRVIEIRRKLEAESLDIISRAARGGDEVVETTVKITKGGPEVTRTRKKERKQWQAAAWYLERTWPEDYAQKHIIPDSDQRSPQDVAQDIRDTFNLMMGSVPTGEGGGEQPDA